MMLTALADVARSAGLTVIEVAGWQARGARDDRGAVQGMTDVKTITCHHTAGPASGDFPSLRIVRDGRPDLSGPLAQLGLARSGAVYVIAAGLANHAGPSLDPTYTNPHAIGIEAENTGTAGDPWPGVQIDAYVRLCRALADHYRVPYSRILGHKETCSPPGRKIDPSLDMRALRARIAAIGTRPTPPEDDMPLTDADIEKVADRVVAKLRVMPLNVKNYANPPDGKDFELRKNRPFVTVIEDMSAYASQASRRGK